MPVRWKLVHDLRERIYHRRKNFDDVLPSNEEQTIRIEQNQLTNNSRKCLPKSRRNMGRPGSFTENVIEIGSQFYRFIPKKSKRWSKRTLRSENHIIKVKLPHRKG